MLQHFQHFKACGLNGRRSKKNLDLFALILWVSHQDLFWYRSLAASLVVLSVGKVCFISAELQIWSVVYVGTFLSVKTRNHTLSYRTTNAITFWRIVWVRKNLKRLWDNITRNSSLESDRNQIKNDFISLGKIPYRQLFTSLPFWAITVAHTTHLFNLYTFIQLFPKYLRDIQGKIRYNQTSWLGCTN